MRRAPVIAVGAAVLAAVAWQAAPALQNSSDPSEPAATTAKPTPPKPAPPGPAAGSAAAVNPSKPVVEPLVRALTPMAERVATVGLLNKRNGLWRDLTMKPGQALRIGDVVVRLKACETTAPWEPERYTGAFVQLIVLGSDEKWRKVFSGWLYKESPSLNVVEHPIYDVWTKNCAMRHPDTGPDTSVIRGGEPKASSPKSKARKSAVPPADNAEDSNTI